MKNLIIAACALLTLTGCFTLYHTENPVTQISPLEEGKELRVQLSGFEAIFTTYQPVHSYTTVWGHDSSYARHGRHANDVHSETYSTTTYIPQINASTLFRDNATDSLEAAGFIVVAKDPDYIIDLVYAGPAVTDGTKAARFCTVLFSLLTADYDKETWTARLKIREAKSGKVVHFCEYSQECAVTVWGPIPIFSPLSAEATDDTAMKIWSLAALTNRAVADASAFLANRAKE